MWLDGAGLDLGADANDPRWRRRRDAASVHFHGKNWPRERGGLGRKFGTMPWLPDTMSWPKVAKTAILQVSSTQLEKNRHQVMKTAKVSVLRWSFRKLYSARVIAPLLPETHLFWVHFQPQHSSKAVKLWTSSSLVIKWGRKEDRGGEFLWLFFCRKHHKKKK